MGPGTACAVVECSETDPGRTFHPFPQNPILQQLWQKACNLDTVDPVAVVCSAHFSQHDFVENKEDGTKFLDEAAVPETGKLDTDATIAFLRDVDAEMSKNDDAKASGTKKPSTTTNKEVSKPSDEDAVPDEIDTKATIALLEDAESELEKEDYLSKTAARKDGSWSDSGEGEARPIVWGVKVTAPALPPTGILAGQFSGSSSDPLNIVLPTAPLPMVELQAQGGEVHVSNNTNRPNQKGEFQSRVLHRVPGWNCPRGNVEREIEVTSQGCQNIPVNNQTLARARMAALGFDNLDDMIKEIQVLRKQVSETGGRNIAVNKGIIAIPARSKLNVVARAPQMAEVKDLSGNTQQMVKQIQELRRQVNAMRDRTTLHKMYLEQKQLVQELTQKITMYEIERRGGCKSPKRLWIKNTTSCKKCMTT